MGNKAYLNRVRKIMELEKEIKELQAQVDGIKDEIKSDMRASESDEVDLGDYVIRYRAVTSNRFDSTAFKKAHSKMYAAFCNQTTSMRFTIN